MSRKPKSNKTLSPQKVKEHRDAHAAAMKRLGLDPDKELSDARPKSRKAK